MLSQAEQKAIIQTNYRSIYHLCLYRLRNEEAALDVTQDTFLLMIEKAAGLTNDYIRQWLNRVAENKCKAWLRKHKRERAQLRLDELHPDALDRLLSRVGDCSLGAYYEKYEAVMLERLSPKEALLCELRFARGLTPAEIAERLHIKVDAVNTRLSRLKKKMGKIIEEDIPFL